jgi:Domain of unknown function (DUF1996)
VFQAVPILQTLPTSRQSLAQGAFVQTSTFLSERIPCYLYSPRPDLLCRCWNGVDLDPPDHSVSGLTLYMDIVLILPQSHVAHPFGGIFGTDCPPSHPVRLPLLFIEIVWDTRPFNDPSIWPEDGSQPFVFSMGDP